MVACELSRTRKLSLDDAWYGQQSSMPVNKVIKSDKLTYVVTS